MHNRMDRDVRAIWVAALSLAMLTAASPAERTVSPAGQVQATDEIIEEVEIIGRRGSYVYQRAQPLFNWLARLVGEFTIEGYVDVTPLNGSREVLTAEGTANCIGFGVAPGVQCDLRIRWPEKSTADGGEVPGATPTLDPAMMLFGFKENGYNYDRREFEISQYSIKHVLIDNRGIFESGHGVHDGG